MKKIFNIILIVSGLGFFSSCKDVLEAPAKSALEESLIFTNVELAEGEITGILQSFAETNSYRGRYLVNFGVNTDVEVNNGLKSNDDRAILTNYAATETNGQMNTSDNVYAKLYEGIERANLAIRGLRK